MHSDRGYHVARRVKGWEDPHQNDPQNWGFENFWGRGTFYVCPLCRVITLILPVHIMGLSTLIKKSFYSAGIAFHLAEIWNFKVSKCWTFFCESEAVYNGLMVRFHKDRALMVRDRPPNVFRVE